jgi:hypothetical protein
MKISGFTIIKNAVHNDYPIVEAICSILPVVDEMVVLVGDCSDTTRQLIESIGDAKIRIFDSVWDPNLRTGGAVLAAETDKAFALIDPASDWAFYIQGDEVVPEQSHPAIKAACEKYLHQEQVLGLVFKYLHFYGTYDYVGDSRVWYNKEIRIIRNDKRISAYRDAQGFRMGNKKLPSKLINAWVYHYGWVKSPAQMKKKMKDAAKYWISRPEELNAFMTSEDVFNFDDFDSIKKFTGVHPACMQKRVQEQKQNWHVELDTTKKKLSFKNRFLYMIEKLTGIRLFSFKNYKIIR